MKNKNRNINHISHMCQPFLDFFFFFDIKRILEKNKNQPKVIGGIDLLWDCLYSRVECFLISKTFYLFLLNVLKKWKN